MALGRAEQSSRQEEKCPDMGRRKRRRRQAGGNGRWVRRSDAAPVDLPLLVVPNRWPSTGRSQDLDPPAAVVAALNVSALFAVRLPTCRTA